MTANPSPAHRPAWLVPVAAVAVALLLAVQVKSFLDDPKILPPDDVVEYWAAGRLNAQGKNPYDPDLLLPLQQTTGRPDVLPENQQPGDTPQAIMMWNPPWTLTLVMPLGLLPPRFGQLVWLLLNLGIIFWSADKTWRLFGGPIELRWVAWLLAGCFLPTGYVLIAGQITAFLLLGAVGFLHFEGRQQDFLAGVSAALLGIKPHLVYLFWVALLVWSIRQRRWGVILGGGVAGVAATLIPVLFNPAVFQQYREALINHPPAQWISATPGAWLRLFFGSEGFWLQFVPNGLGLLWLAFYLYRQPDRPWSDMLPALFLVSFATAAYGAWPFDLVLLLLPILQGAALLAQNRGSKGELRRELAWFVAIDAGMLGMNLASLPSFWYVWVSPALLIARSLGQPAAREMSRETISAERGTAPKE